MFAAAVAVSLVAISGRSLWIDEACTAIRAIQPTLGAWWQTMEQEKTGCLQMPLYMLYTWGWTKIFGSDEWSFHLANLPLFAAGAGAFILSFPSAGRGRLLAGCLVLLCPFAWYYLDEARPYAMQLGASLLIVASLRRIAHACDSGSRRYGGHLALFLAGIVILGGSSLFGMIWAAAALGALLLLLPLSGLTGLLKRLSWLWLAAAVPLIGLAVYYVWTLKMGARGSGAATTTLGSVLFVGYELLGFAGLGPGRLDMRSAGLTSLHGYLAPVALYAVAMATLIGAAILRVLTEAPTPSTSPSAAEASPSPLLKGRGVPQIGPAALRGLKSWNRRHLGIVLCCCLPPVFILGAGWVVHFRVLGRHLAPFVPCLLLLLTLGASALWSQGSRWARAQVVVFCLLSLFSCLSVRFAARHEKDNYRAAAAAAKAALDKGQAVWWNAAEEGALYYGVPVTSGVAIEGKAIFLMDPTRESLGALPLPGLIVASKPDIYDGQMALAEFIREQGYREVGRFQAFILWERRAGSEIRNPKPEIRRKAEIRNPNCPCWGETGVRPRKLWFGFRVSGFGFPPGRRAKTFPSLAFEGKMDAGRRLPAGAATAGRQFI